MSTTTTSLKRRIAAATQLAIGASAVAIAALTIGAPAANAATIQQSCEQNPGAYAAGAVRGVYYTRKSGNDREQVCDTFDAAGKMLGRYISVDYGWYLNPKNQRPESVSPPLAVWK